MTFNFKESMPMSESIRKRSILMRCILLFEGLDMPTNSVIYSKSWVKMSNSSRAANLPFSQSSLQFFKPK